MDRAIRIVVTGDVADWHVPAFDVRRIPESILRVIRASDLFVTNLEGPIRTSEGPPARRPRPGSLFELAYRMAARLIGKPQPTVYSTPRILEILRLGRRNCVCLANNHTGDLGAAGIRETLTLLREQGIPHLGAGENRRTANETRLFHVEGRPIAVLNYNFVGMKKGPVFLNVFGATRRGAGAAYLSPAGIRREIASMRQRAPGAWVLLVVHAGRAAAGRAATPKPDDAGVDDRLFEQLGADCVVFHHSHAFLGTRTGRSFFLGDFVFAHPGSLPEDRVGGLVEIVLDPGSGSFEHLVHTYRFREGYPVLPATRTIAPPAGMPTDRPC